MTDSRQHPTPERLEAFVEDGIASAERERLEAHLLACSRCRGEVDALEALFADLAALPRPEPTAGFRDRVMAAVPAVEPRPSRVAASLARLVPRTTRDWGWIAAFLALPVLGAGAAVAWLASQPWIGAAGLWPFAQERVAMMFTLLANRVITLLLDTQVAAWIGAAAHTLAGLAEPRHLGIAASVFAVLTLVSGWILYQNVLRHPTRDTRYGSYCV